MRPLRNLAALAVLSVLFGSPAAAAPAEAFHEAVAAAYDPFREAVHYLETGNAGLAALALERARDAWRQVEGKFVATPPQGFKDDPTWRESLIGIGKALDNGLAAADRGDAPAALAALGAVRPRLAALRLRGNQRVYSDCIDAMNAAMDRLWVFRRTPPRRARPETISAFKAAIAETETWYRRCREEAPLPLRGNPEFRRLFDGALASLARLVPAAEADNEDLIVSLLRELRSFDKLIWLRFG
jgi:hypothetical protein